MRVVVVYNPTAGGDGFDPDELRPPLAAAGHVAAFQSIKEDDWHAALDPRAELVAVAGGDGTVRKVFRRLAGTDWTVTVFPEGTANNIARSLGFGEEDPGRLIQGWADGRLLWCDLGTVTTAGGDESFVESAGGGLFAEVLARADSGRREPGQDKIEFGLQSLCELAPELPAREWGVWADGVELSGEHLDVEAMNVPEIGPKIPVAPEADPGDGLLELTLIRESHRSGLVAYLDARLEERRAELPALDVRRAREIVLRPPGAAPFHCDDEPVRLEGSAESTVRVDVKDRVRVLLPAPLRHHGRECSEFR